MIGLLGVQMRDGGQDAVSNHADVREPPVEIVPCRTGRHRDFQPAPTSPILSSPVTGTSSRNPV